MRFGPLLISYGKREWEIQAVKDGHLVNFSGKPYMPKRCALRASRLWARQEDLWDDVRVVNVRTGERVSASN